MIWYLHHHGISTIVSLATFCPHTELLQFYWLYSSHCTWHPSWLIYFITGNLYFFIPFTYFAQSPIPPFLWQSLIRSLDYESAFILSCFSDFIFKCDHTVFVFLWLNSMSWYLLDTFMLLQMIRFHLKKMISYNNLSGPQRTMNIPPMCCLLLSSACFPVPRPYCRPCFLFC